MPSLKTILHFSICSLSILLSSFAHAVDVERTEVHAFVEKLVSTHKFDRAYVENTLRAAETLQPILDAISKPAERTIPWYEYRSRFLVEKRIDLAKAFQTTHAETLKTLAEQGAPIPEVLAILGVETYYGQNTGRYRVLDALATLGFDYPPRSTFFLYELEEFFLLARDLNIDMTQPLGSYAGAMGSPQFMPHSYRQFGVDGNHDGKIDLWTQWDDILNSVANYLKQHGWKTGEPVLATAEYTPSEPLPYTLGEIALTETVASLKKKGVKFSTTLPDTSPATLLVLEGKDGAEYRVGFNNFYVITRYNRSPLYANAVYDLGQVITANDQPAAQ